MPGMAAMRIEASQLSYVTAHHSASATVVLDETLTRTPTADTRTATPVDTVQLSGRTGLSAASGYDDLNDLDPKQRLAILILESILGHKIRLMRSSSCGAAPAASVPANAPASAPTVEAHQRIELHSEVEQTSFQAQGVVETVDGRHIQFSVELNMQRAFQSSSVTVGVASTTDPLVVNLGGAPARITGAKIAFDLNSDGNAEDFSFVAAGSGFLAVDSNGDGKVNDGGELFGPRTGNGFADLAAYDADGNGWVDENDPIFTKLRVWTQDGLSTLSENGIGAISTSSAETPFALKDATNALQANVRATGIYLSEDGAAGTIQQVDLADA